LYFDIIDIIAEILFRNILLLFEFLYNLLLILLLKDDNKHFITFFSFFYFPMKFHVFVQWPFSIHLVLPQQFLNMIQVPIFCNIIFLDTSFRLLF